MNSLSPISGTPDLYLRPTHVSRVQGQEIEMPEKNPPRANRFGDRRRSNGTSRSRSRSRSLTRSFSRSLHREIAATLMVGAFGIAAVSTAEVAPALAANPCVSGGVSVTRWNGGSGDWDNAGNWDQGVPDGTKIACITAPGSFVTAGIVHNATAAAIELGGSTGTETLQIFGVPFNHHGLLTLANQDPALGVESNGRIVLAETHKVNNILEPTQGKVTVGSGTLTNRGTIVSSYVASGPNTLTGNFDNQGLLQVDETLVSPAPAVWTSSGNILIAASREVDLSWGPSGSFTQTAGTIVNNGIYRQYGGAYVASGSGSETGNPLQFEGSVTISPSGTGSGAFEIRSGSDTLGSDVSAGYTVRIAGAPNNHNGMLTVPVNRTNRGAIRLGSTDGTSGTLTMSSGATLTNVNTIVADVNNNSGNPDHITGTLDNQANLQLDENTNDNFSSVWTSSGSVSIAAGKEVDLNWSSGGGSFSQTAGTFVNNGVYRQFAGVFLATGTGTQTGNALQFDGNVTISGDGTQGTLQVASGVFTNRGTISSEYTDVGHNNGPNHLIGAIDTQGQISALVNDIDRTGAITNGGTVTRGVGRSISFTSSSQRAGARTVGAGGTLTTDSHTVILQGGMLSGDGTVQADVSNTGGTVHPGHSPGTLTVQGKYSQTAGGALAIDVAGTTPGTGYSQLSATGTATLSGASNATTSPQQTGTLRIVTGGAVSGTFAPVA